MSSTIKKWSIEIRAYNGWNIFQFVEITGQNKTRYFNVMKAKQSGPLMCNAAKGYKVAHHCVESSISGIWHTSGH